MNRIITLTTDFGLTDEYIGAVKGVILSINPDVKIVDITHQIPKYNIRKGALVLRSVIPYYPPSSIHIGIVDPGVGSERNIIIVKTRSEKYLVGPDNGLLYPTALREGVLKIVKFTNLKYSLRRVSDTFHGRDIMAPIAAYLTKNVSLEDFGCEIKGIIPLELEYYKLLERGVEGKVIDVDDFGNIITSLPVSILFESLNKRVEYFTLLIRGAKFNVKVGRIFADTSEGGLIALPGSKGFIEIAVNKGSAAKNLGANIGDIIQLIYNSG
ncbi:MAG: SAM-dependent chlorinase/fluorinase [Candidatus Odinarchaeum yellowstonii]|uniref:SAM-dependent chlorinase/fluorinase n=1 Tax=Odinarchaeota yellowstonii (strain LCB_4) TaxID=1841599 RepID=A0AAF0D155_ODILC|nr:MAG: SAM-dependent chlorinase/fluorinase [Candidatus Odinarchaeum yellowstonii]